MRWKRKEKAVRNKWTRAKADRRTIWLSKTLDRAEAHYGTYHLNLGERISTPTWQQLNWNVSLINFLGNGFDGVKRYSF